MPPGAILAIETATPRGSVALVSGGAVLAVRRLPAGMQASATILSAVTGILAEAGCLPEEVASVAVSAGPGSFTGLRVGMAAAKGLCFGWGVPIVPVPTLHALASRFRGMDAAVCPVLDARKKEVYAALFRPDGEGCARISPDMAVSPEVLSGILPDGRVFFCGDGVPAYGGLFRERLGDRALFAPEEEGLPDASAVGLLAASLEPRRNGDTVRTLVPVYVRRSEAETRRLPPN